MFRPYIAAQLSLLALGLVQGCQPLARVHYRAGGDLPKATPRHQAPSAANGASRGHVFATDFGEPPTTPSPARLPPAPTSPAPSQPASAPSPQPAPEATEAASTEDEKKSGADAPAEKPAPPATGYTAPSEAIRRLILMTAVATTSDGSTGSGSTGKEFAESSTGLSGAPGLSAPVVSAQSGGVTGPPGLQEGPASALGPISNNNVFQPVRNTLLGANGGCAALSRGGFFQGSEAGCRSFFEPNLRSRNGHGAAKFARK